MAELLNVKCKQGKLIITDQAIIIELPRFFGFGKLKDQLLKSETMLRSAFVDLDAKVPFLYTASGITNFTFYGQGNKVLHADLVNAEDAQAVKAILTGRE